MRIHTTYSYLCDTSAYPRGRGHALGAKGIPTSARIKISRRGCRRSVLSQPGTRLRLLASTAHSPDAVVPSLRTRWRQDLGSPSITRKVPTPTISNLFTADRPLASTRLRTALRAISTKPPAESGTTPHTTETSLSTRCRRRRTARTPTMGLIPLITRKALIITIWP